MLSHSHRMDSLRGALSCTPARAVFAALCLLLSAQRVGMAQQENLAEVMRQYEMQASALLRQGRLLEAEQVGNQMLALATREAGEGSTMHAAALSALGAVCNESARYQEAVDYGLKTVAILERNLGPNHRALAGALTKVFIAYANQHRYADAARLHRRALAIAQSGFGANSVRATESIESLAQVYDQMGHFPEAETLYSRALALQIRNHGAESLEVAINLANTGMMYRRQQRLGEAETFLRRALTLRRWITNPTWLANILQELATLCTINGRYEEAESLIKQARDAYIAQYGPDHPIVETMHGLADIYEAQGRYADAEVIYRRVLAAEERHYGAENTQVARTLMALAFCRWSQKMADVTDYTGRALAIYNKIGGSPVDEADAHLLNGQIEWRAGKHDKAIAEFEISMRLTDDLRANVSGGEHERGQSFAGVQDRYAIPAQLLLEGGRFAAGFSALERGRNRALLEQMAAAHVDLLEGLPPDEARQLQLEEQQAQTDIATLDRQLEMLPDRQDLNDQQRAEEQTRLRDQLAAARQRAVSIYSTIRTRSPVYRRIVGQELKLADLSAVQTWLGERDALLLYYSVTDLGVHVFCVEGPNSLPSDTQLRTTEELAKVLDVPTGNLTADQLDHLLANQAGDGVLQLLSRPGKQKQPATKDDTKTEGQDPDVRTQKLSALWRLLIPEAQRARLLDGSLKHLIIVPDGPLALLPFEALVTEIGEAPRYLLDAGPAVNYSPSATVLLQLATRPATNAQAGVDPVLTVGDPAYRSPTLNPLPASPAPQDAQRSQRYAGNSGRLPQLPHSGNEASWVAEVFRKQGLPATLLKRDQATEQAVRAGVVGRRFIHLACHGLTDPAYGNFFGALVVAAGAGPSNNAANNAVNDGFLTLTEIYDLNLATCDLAILSACVTNYGPRQQGEGTWTLARGFLVAGARRVVASDWLVDDEAAASLVSYYCSLIAKQEHNAQSSGFAQSLTDAKRWIRQQPKWQDPYYWATFVLIGPP